MSGWFQGSKQSKPPKEIVVLKNSPVYPRNQNLVRRSQSTTSEDDNDNTRRRLSYGESGAADRSRSKSRSQSPDVHERIKEYRARSKSASRRRRSESPQKRARSKSASRRNSGTEVGGETSAHSRSRSLTGTILSSPRRESSAHSRGRTLSINNDGKSPSALRSKSLNRTPSSRSVGKGTSGVERGGLIRTLSGRSFGESSTGQGQGRGISRSNSGQSITGSIHSNHSRTSVGVGNRGRSQSNSNHSRDIARSRSRSQSRGRTLSGGGSNGSSPAVRSRSNSATRTFSLVGGSGTKKPVPKTACCGETSAWHGAIVRQDWDTLERLLKNYDHVKYKDPIKKRQQREQDQKKKPQRRLRVMKYFSKGGSGGNGSTPNKQTDEEEYEELEIDESVSPLLYVDNQGRTPLHYACKDQKISQKLLQRLLFSERDATFVPDQDGRLPLHVAMLFQTNLQVLDKVIRANPAGLIHQDCLNQTPMVYAIRQAIHQRDRRTSGVVTWRIPTTAAQAEWHSSQTAKWSKVKFVLDIFETRHMTFTRRQAEGDLILEALESLAPPTIIVQLLQHSVKFLSAQTSEGKYGNDETLAALNEANQARSVKVLSKLCRFHYPMTCIHTLLKILGHKTLPQKFRNVMLQGYIEHYREGCVNIQRQQEAAKSQGEDNQDDESVASSSSAGGPSSFRAELLQTQRQRQMGDNVVATLPCQEWWTKLRFFIKNCCPHLNQGAKLLDDYILHAALGIPETPPSLVELLIRLMPHARYEVDPATGALPIHLACRYWVGIDGSELKKLASGNNDNKVGSDEVEPSVEMVLNLLLAGDFSLVWRRYKSRLPLHLAIMGSKPLSVLQTLISLDRKTASVRDPVTKLFPFQLAAMARDAAGRSAGLKSLASSRPSFTNGMGTGGSGFDKKLLRRMLDLEQLGTIYDLLRACPSVVLPSVRRGDLNLPPGVVGPVANHFLEWFYHYKMRSSGNGSLAVDKARMKLIRDAVSAGEVTGQLGPWWNQMKFWIWHCYENPTGRQRKLAKLPHQDDFLLHAALFNEETPPIVIELILELQPKSVSKPIPGTHLYPLHIAAATPAYAPMSFEKTVSMMSAIDMLLIMYHQAAHIECNNRLPLHIAIAAGKTWKEIKPLVENNPTSLSVPDPLSGLFPFQLLAARHTSVPIHKVVTMETRLVNWDDIITASSSSNAQSSGGGGATMNGCGKLIRAIRNDYELDILSSIFEVLTQKPEALEASLRVVNSPRRSRLINVGKSWSDSLSNCGIQDWLEGSCLPRTTTTAYAN